MGKSAGYPAYRKLWAIWFLIHFLLFFLPLYPLFYLLLSREAWYPKAHALRKAWGRYILFMAGMRPQVEWEEQIDLDQVYVLAPNHSSYIDIPAITVMLPHYFIFMAKDELRKIPLFGRFFKTIDIAVDRKKIKASHRAFLEAGARIANGTSVCVFPEGTIPQSAPELGRFKDGAFKLAIEKQVPLLPITLPDNHYRLPDDGSLTAKAGKMRMYVHRPIPTAGLKVEDLPELKQQVFRIIEAKLEEYASQ